MTTAILLDATAIPADRGGVGRYVEELARALADQDARLTIVTQAAQAADFAALVPAATVVAATAMAKVVAPIVVPGPTVGAAAATTVAVAATTETPAAARRSPSDTSLKQVC